MLKNEKIKVYSPTQSADEGHVIWLRALNEHTYGFIYTKRYLLSFDHKNTSEDAQTATGHTADIKPNTERMGPSFKSF